MAFIRKVLNVAVAEGRMASNPMDQLKMFKESTGATRFLSLEEEQLLCDGLGQPYAKWVRLALLTGMRRKEQFSLRRDQVDLVRGVITLPTTKAGVVQYVRLNAEARAILQDLEDEAVKADTVAEAEAIAEHRPTGKKRSIWVFPSENPRTHISPENFYRRVYLPKVKELGLHGVTWHTLRHTFASRLAMAGVSPVTIAALLRHSDITLVKRYAHLDPSHLKDEIEKASSFGKPTPLLSSTAKTTGENIQEVIDDLPAIPDGDSSEAAHPSVTEAGMGRKGEIA
jgi:integrase